jgi:hypothetical protein
MRFLLFATIFILIQDCIAQTNTRVFKIHYQWSPTVTFNNRFEGGATSVRSPDNQTGVNTIYPLYSLLDGMPNRKLSFAQNFARKFTWQILLESVLNDKRSLITGFEIGSRGYKVISNSSVSSLISYRNLAVPVILSHSKTISRFWTLKLNYGTLLNYSFSLPKYNRVVSINKNPAFYPLIGGGLEMAYMGKEGRFAFEVAFYKGWQNVIDHVYIGVDNNLGVRITSDGTHLRAGIRYKYRQFEREKSKRKKVETESVVPVIIEVPIITRDTIDYSNRNLKTPWPIKINQETLRICFTDDQTVDGDSIVVVFNGAWLTNNMALTKTPQCFDLRLRQDSNVLVIHALNEGRIKPNTFQIDFPNIAALQSVRLKSDMKNSAVIEFLYAPD